MVNSMTGFARTVSELEIGRVTFEVKTVNQRYLDVNFRLPELFRRFEVDLRHALQTTLSRGKVDVSLRFVPGEQAQYDLVINRPLVAKLAQCVDTLNAEFSDYKPKLQAMDVLQFPGVMSNQDHLDDTVKAALLNAFADNLVVLKDMRGREGARLKAMIAARLIEVESIAAAVAQNMSALMQMQRDKLLQRIADLQVDVLQERFEQELVLLLQRADVDEELSRLQAHCQEVRDVLQRNEPIGRRLDFLMQELNREANTLGSKACDNSLTKASVELKVLIEQMREQVQNIE